MQYCVGMATARTLPDDLLARGVSVFDADDAAAALGIEGPALYAALHRLRRGGRTISPARGIYVAVPPHYRDWGGVPAEQYIDELMRRLGRAYYVGLLSAAELLGASHHAPQAFQVMVDRALPSRSVGRVRLEYHVARHVGAVPTVERAVPTGVLRHSGPSLTAVDLVAFARAAGGIDNVAGVIGELDGLEPVELALHCLARPRSVAARLGWMLERVQPGLDLDPLDRVVGRGDATPALLDAAGPRRGRLDPRWRVRVNADLEVEA